MWHTLSLVRYRVGRRVRLKALYKEVSIHLWFVCGSILILVTVILLILIGELFEYLFRYLSRKAGVPSSNVKSLLQNPDIEIDISPRFFLKHQ